MDTRSSGQLKLNWSIRWLAWVAAMAALPVLAIAQDASSPDPPSIEFPDTWIGGDGVQVEHLRGKAALLYFYEEGCPKCKDRWPGLMELAGRYEHQPIVFIAVNSGTPAPQVAAYARSVGLTWPVIVDLDRSFEQACGVGEISLQNIVQVAYLTPDGEIRRGSWSRMEETIERALEGAAWHVDPQDVPPELWPVWRSIEFGQYAPVAQALARARSSRQPDIKETAEKLTDVVGVQAGDALSAAESEAQQSKYRAHAQYATITDRFAGYPAADEANTAARRLMRDAEYRQELSALRQLEKQAANLNSPREAIRQRAIAAIERIIDEQPPESEPARVGRALLAVR